MIKTETYMTRGDGVTLVRTWSNAGHRIRQNETGAVYDEAIDVEGAPYTYTETEETVEELIEGDSP